MWPWRLSREAAGWARRALVWLALALAILIRLAEPEPLTSLRNGFFDFAQRLLPPDAAEVPLAVVDIDDASLHRLGQWPWPRDLLADLVREIARHEPRALGVTLLFPERDRLSPESLIERFPLDAPLRESLAALPSNDALFAAALAGVPAVLGAAVASGGEMPAGAAPQSAPVLLQLDYDSTAELRRYPGLLRSLPQLEAAASGVGVASIAFGSDGVVRRMPIVMLVGDAVLPSFALEVVRVARGVPAISVAIDGPGIAGVSLGDLQIRTAYSGKVWLREVPLARIERVSAAALLAGEAPAAPLADRIVLLGTSGAGLARSFVTPAGAAVSALDVQALFVENLLAQRYLLRPPAALVWELAAMAVLLLGFLALRRRLPGQPGLLIVALALLILVAGALYAFDRHGLLLDPTYPGLVLLVAYLATAGLGIVEAQRQRKRSEEERQMALVLAEAANRSKSSFLANMSHELRTPLNAILGFSEMMQRGILGPVQPAKYRDYVDDIHHMGRHLLSLVNDVLEMSKVEAGESQLSESEFTVREPLEDCIRTVTAAYRQRSADITLDRQSVLPSLRGDRRMFTQMVMNLLSNAVKYTPDGGRIRVIGTLADNGSFRLSISDTGIGMSDKEMLDAFEPFRRIDHALTANFEGIGLGLPLTKAMIEMHGGKLEIASISNHGTTATLVFPPERVRGPSERQKERA